QDLSLLFWSIRLRRGSSRSARNCAVSELVLVQYLRDFFVVARHTGAAFHLLREETVQKDSRRDGRGGAFCRRTRQVAHASAGGRDTGFLGQLFSGAPP